MNLLGWMRAPEESLAQWDDHVALAAAVRAGDPSGIAYWAGYLDRGGRDETIESGLIGAPEYLARAGS